MNSWQCCHTTGCIPDRKKWWGYVSDGDVEVKSMSEKQDVGDGDEDSMPNVCAVTPPSCACLTKPSIGTRCVWEGSKIHCKWTEIFIGQHQCIIPFLLDRTSAAAWALPRQQAMLVCLNSWKCSEMGQSLMRFQKLTGNSGWLAAGCPKDHVMQIAK